MVFFLLHILKDNCMEFYMALLFMEIKTCQTITGKKKV